MRDDDATAAAADWTRFLESLLRGLVFAAGAWAWTFWTFVFRPRRFDAAVLDERDGPVGRFHLGPLSFLLVNLVLYFWVYPRREQGPTRAVIAAAPAPLSRALDRIEAVVARPDLPTVLMVVGPLVLLAALHALVTTRAFRLGGAPLRFETQLAVTCYAAGSLLAALALSAIVGATLTDRAVAGTLVGAGLAAYLALMVAPFVALFLWCMARYVLLTRAAAGTGLVRTGAVILGTTLLVVTLVGLLLVANGVRGT